jgi:hypothetical protein
VKSRLAVIRTSTALLASVLMGICGHHVNAVDKAEVVTSCSFLGDLREVGGELVAPDGISTESALSAQHLARIIPQIAVVLAAFPLFQ